MLLYLNMTIYFLYIDYVLIRNIWLQSLLELEFKLLSLMEHFKIQLHFNTQESTYTGVSSLKRNQHHCINRKVAPQVFKNLSSVRFICKQSNKATMDNEKYLKYPLSMLHLTLLQAFYFLNYLKKKLIQRSKLKYLLESC